VAIWMLASAALGAHDQDTDEGFRVFPSAIEWTTEVSAGAIAPPVVASGHVIVALQSGRVSATRIADKKDSWTAELAATTALAAADDLVVVPDGIEPVQAAMLKINPLTAWRLLHDYVELQKGDWLIQNAANSAAGRDIIQIAHEIGYKTMNVVRRAELIDELRAEGGDAVLVDDENLREQVKSATRGAPIRLGLNSVGGDSALRLANCLAPGGTLVSFGAMSLQPLKIPTGLLIFKDLRFRGIWINKWYDNATPSECMETFQPIFEMARRGLLKTKVEKAYPLSEVKAAVVHAAQGKRSGKIIFEFE